MSLHRIYAPQGIFSAEDKASLSKRVTASYTSMGLPAFYVVVLFIDVSEESFYVGGESRKNFVRIVSQHLARVLPTEQYSQCIDQLELAWEPFIKDRGLLWEMHIEELERDFWRTQGLVPPLPDTNAERRWAKENKAVPYNEFSNSLSPFLVMKYDFTNHHAEETRGTTNTTEWEIFPEM